MFKGIQFLLFISITSAGFSGIAHAGKKSDSDIASSAIKACKRFKSAQFTVDRKPLKRENGKVFDCYRVKCSVSTAGASGVSAADVGAQFPDGISESGGVIAGWSKQKCDEIKIKSDDDIIGDLDGDGNLDIDIDLDGGGNGKWCWYNFTKMLCSSSKYQRKCVRRSHSKCGLRRRGGGGADIDWDYDIDGNGGRRRRGGGGSGGYVILERDGRKFRCNYTSSWKECKGDDSDIVISIHGDADGCIDCENNRRRRSKRSGSGRGTLSGIAEIVGGIAGPLAYFGVGALQANAYLGANKAWAGAAATGFEQCQLMQTNYVQNTYSFIQSNELPDRDVMPPGCNGYGLGGFAGGMGLMGNGMGGMGNPWGSAGYSPGFMAGMYGPYGMQGSGMGMGMGMNGMGMGMGMGMNGMGMNGMGMPGMGLNIGLNGGMGMGYPGMGGGMGMNGYPGMGGGIGGGMYGNPYGGAYGNGTVPWGNGAGSYWNGSGGWGNQGQGNWGNIQQSYQMNNQALNADTYYQQQGLQGAYNQAAQNLYSHGYQGGGYGGYGGGGYGGYGGGYGGQMGYNPSYSPMNLGISLNGGFGYGF